jgi:1-phosphofructokinase family hexose kinase
MKIYTLTLSPAYDVHASAEELCLGKENLVTVTSREVGGKGINISRALLSMGIESTPVALIGDENSTEYEEALKKEGLNAKLIRVDGRIRENLTLHHGGGETRISYKGFFAPKNLAELIKKEISPAPCDILTLTGRLPEGISPSDLYYFLISLRDSGVKLVIDSRSYSANDIAALRPWLVKPNREEIETYFGERTDSLTELSKNKDALMTLGCENLLVTLDSEGAALFSDGGILTVGSPRVKAISTIGAGDSAIAGFIYAYASGLTKSEALRYAVAFGSAAVLTEGTLPPRGEDIKELLNKLK